MGTARRFGPTFRHVSALRMPWDPLQNVPSRAPTPQRRKTTQDSGTAVVLRGEWRERARVSRSMVRSFGEMRNNKSTRCRVVVLLAFC